VETYKDKCGRELPCFNFKEREMEFGLVLLLSMSGLGWAVADNYKTKYLRTKKENQDLKRRLGK
jgi:hypothetical protein